jgi:hypothetical protein
MPAEELYGIPLRYFKDRPKDNPYKGSRDEVVLVGYNADRLPLSGIPVKYCTLLDHEEGGRCGPYLAPKVPDPKQNGYYRNIHNQLELAQHQRFKLIEWDHADNEHFEEFDVKRAIDLALVYQIGVLFKNPGAIKKYDPTPHIKHPNIYGIIVEKECGSVMAMDSLRRAAGKPYLPIWFVAFGDRHWADLAAIDAAKYTNVGVTFSPTGEYQDSIDILVPSAVKNVVVEKI